jgi:hypothetical protein
MNGERKPDTDCGIGYWSSNCSVNVLKRVRRWFGVVDRRSQRGYDGLDSTALVQNDASRRDVADSWEVRLPAVFAGVPGSMGRSAQGGVPAASGRDAAIHACFAGSANSNGQHRQRGGQLSIHHPKMSLCA